MTLIPNILVPIIESEKISNNNIHDELKNKRVIIFGVPGAFTPTCSEKHLPGYIKMYDSLKKKNIDDIYCLSVNDPFVMKAWLSNYNKHQIKGIADGNGHLSRLLKVISDQSSNFMGFRSQRFAMLVDNLKIIWIFIEDPGKFKDSSAENILSKL